MRYLPNAFLGVCVAAVLVSSTNIHGSVVESFSSEEVSPISTESVYENPHNPRLSAFSFSLKGHRYYLSTASHHELFGNGAVASIGWGRISEKYGYFGELDFYIGPYTKSNQLEIDYRGNGLTAWAFYSADSRSLRQSGSFGLNIGLSYVGLVGESFGKNLKQVGPDPYSPNNLGLLDQYEIQVNQFSVIPGISWINMRRPRPESNKPDLLLTRIEGYMITLGVSLPVFSTYRANYRKKAVSKDNNSSKLEDLIETESGYLEGLTVVLQWTTWIGI